jgi:hypothetical protein
MGVMKLVPYANMKSGSVRKMSADHTNARTSLGTTRSPAAARRASSCEARTTTPATTSSTATMDTTLVRTRSRRLRRLDSGKATRKAKAKVSAAREERNAWRPSTCSATGSPMSAMITK